MTKCNFPRLCDNNALDPDWLAGLIDGDGSFQLSKAGYGSLEVTVASRDQSLLYHCREIYGGKLKLRAGATSLRWRVHDRVNLKRILTVVNGRLHNFARKQQFERLAHAYSICPNAEMPFTWQSSYFSGLFDSDGKITLSIKNHTGPRNEKGVTGKLQRLRRAKAVQLTIGVTQKHKMDIQFLKSKRNSPYGRISYDRAQNGYYTWYVTRRSEVLDLCAYFETHACLSKRAHRVKLVPWYYALHDAGALKQNQNPDWVKFAEQWFKYDLV